MTICAVFDGKRIQDCTRGDEGCICAKERAESAALTKLQSAFMECLANKERAEQKVRVQTNEISGMINNAIIYRRRIRILENSIASLIAALDGAFISSWQSTAQWDKELETARAALKATEAV